MITLVTEGSAAIGFGHLRRSVTLAHELLRQGAAVTLWILQSDADASLSPEVLSHLGDLPWAVGPIPNLAQSSVQILDLDTASQQRLFSGSAWSGTHTLALDWFDTTLLPAVTINLLDHSGRMSAAYAAAGKEHDYHEGPDYAIIRPGLLALKNNAPAAAEVRRVVVTLGGADPAHRSLEALHLLKDATAEIVLIVGPLVPEAYEYELRAAASPGVTLLRNPPDFDQQLASADVVICSGGGTLLESLALAKPTVVLPQTDAERAHAHSHANAGACVFADRLNEVLSSESLRQFLVANARLRVDGQGAARIASTAIELSQRA